DFVPNHTSSKNQWFLDSASDKKNKRSWYIWSDKKLSWDNSMNLNNFYSNGSSYYYAAFSSGMPDLNFRNYEVREEMKNVVRYWLNKGFDGLRVDAARYLIENSSKAYDTQETHDFFKELRSEIDKYSSPKFMVCEAWIENNPSELKKYWGNQNEFNMIFDFNQGRKINESVKNQSESFTSKIETQRPQKSSFGIFLGNHDEYQERLGTGFSGDYKKINLASAISLLRPAVPFVYYGQELGQKNLLVQGDLRLRGKFNWELKDKQLKEEKSPLTLNKALLNFRNQNKDLFSGGTIKILSANPSSKIASYTISTDDKEILCVFNMTKETIENIEISNYQNSSPSFSCIIGDKDSEITYKDGKITLEKIAPYSVRAYSTKGIEEKNIFNDEDYDYTSSDKIPDNVFIPEEMYIRGNFNNWGGDLMKKTESETEVTWEIDIPFNVSGQIQYKFCENNLEDWGSNWGDPNSSDPYHNIIKTVENEKTYSFSISISKKTGEVTTGFSCVN
ncbi:MAG: alpha-amylase family glycosyl hydrolase, partial [Treponema sp.]|nr:alpha-amylase family glycosyl hydrolase [Treponema sp.]